MSTMKKKVANYLLDISKIVFAGGVLSVILEMDGVSKAAILLMGTWTTVFFAAIAFVLMRTD